MTDEAKEPVKKEVPKPVVPQAPKVDVINQEIVAALRRIMEQPFGCPMCRSGAIITEGKQHWDNCGFKMANEVLRKLP